jgi:hypothetical protein
MTTRADDDATTNTAPPRKRRRRRWLIIAALILVPLAIAYLGVCRFLAHKLEATVAAKLDAELTVDRLLYLPPYGLRISGANLTRKNNVLLELGHVDLRLAQSPFRKGPLLIEHFDVDRPVVRIIHTDQGFAGGPGLVKEDVKREPEPKKKFSDILRLRTFKIARGTIVYDDDTTPYARDVTWRDINVEIHSAQKGPSLYTYELTFGNKPIVDVSAAGSVDVDALVLALDHLHLAAHVDPNDRESPLPAAVQHILEQYAVAGRLSFDGKGSLPFREPAKSKYDGSVELAGAKLRLPKWNAALDDASMKLRVTVSPAASGPRAKAGVESIQVAAGGASLTVTGGSIDVDPAGGTWALAQLVGKVQVSPDARAQGGVVHDAIEKFKVAGAIDFTGDASGPLKPDPRVPLADAMQYEALLYPRGVAMKPTKFPEPLREIGGGLIRIAGGEAVAEDLSAKYGNDLWMLNTARVPLAGLRERISIFDADGSIDFHGPSPEYPKALRVTVKALAPEGEFPVHGWVEINPRGEPTKRATYDLVVTSDGNTTFNVTPHRIPITRIRGDAIVRRERIENGIVDIRHFDGESLGGAVSAKATFVTTRPKSWAGTASLRDVRLERLADYVKTEKKEKLVGRAFAEVDLSGESQKDTALDSLRGRGRVEVLDGEFFELPVLGAVSKVVTGDGKRDLGTGGEAAVSFEVEGRTIRIRDGAVSSPLLGVQGDGVVTLDGALDLNLVAAPLADWRERLKDMKIPIISDITGEVAGTLQRVLNAATRGLLYEFRVKGDVKEPKVEVVPSPVLSEAQAVVFGQMLGKVKDKRLIESFRPGENRQEKGN